MNKHHVLPEDTFAHYAFAALFIASVERKSIKEFTHLKHGVFNGRFYTITLDKEVYKPIVDKLSDYEYEFMIEVFTDDEQTDEGVMTLSTSKTGTAVVDDAVEKYGFVVEKEVYEQFTSERVSAMEAFDASMREFDYPYDGPVPVVDDGEDIEELLAEIK